jgi:hypothetical protein
MSPVDKPGYAKKHFTAVARGYVFDQKKFKYENFDGMGSTRVVVHRGYALDVWDYYTQRAVRNHKAEVRLNVAIAIGALGMCVVDAILHEE